MRKALVTLFAFLISMAGVLGGIFAAGGLCAFIWDPAVLQNQLGNQPNRAHPAFWVMGIVMVPAMIVGAVGALLGVALPISHRLGVHLGLLVSPGLPGVIGRWYTLKIMDALAHESRAEST